MCLWIFGIFFDFFNYFLFFLFLSHSFWLFSLSFFHTPFSLFLLMCTTIIRFTFFSIISPNPSNSQYMRIQYYPVLPVHVCVHVLCVCMNIYIYIRFDCSVYRYLFILIRIGSHYSYCKLLHHTLIIFFSFSLARLTIEHIHMYYMQNTQNHTHNRAISLVRCGRSLVNCCFFYWKSLSLLHLLNFFFLFFLLFL